MSAALPYVISYFTVGVIIAAAGVMRGLFARGKLPVALTFAVVLWPILLLAAPESLLRSGDQVDADVESRDALFEQLSQLAQSGSVSLPDDEHNRLTKVARYGNAYISLFGDRSDFGGILNTFWNNDIPPEAYYEVRRATDHLKETYDPATEVRFSLRPPDWYIGFSTEFVKSIAMVDRKKQGRILEAITKIASAPTEIHGDTIKPLTSDMSGLWRCRLGDDRLLYYPHFKSRKVILISFASRSEAYEGTVDVAGLTPL